MGHLKFFADGGMGARTAWMIEPYLDADCGMPLVSPAELQAAIHKAEKAGLAVMVHAVGDRANRELVEIFERLKAMRSDQMENAAAFPNVPHRIEHVQMIRPEDLKRLSQLDVTACVQPHNMLLDINMVDESIGPKGRWTYAFRNLLDAGIRVMFSSDSPVGDPSPLKGIHAAVTRRREDGTPQNGWYPELRISVAEAVWGYTMVPAIAHGLAGKLGSITPGKRADMIVLDRDIYQIDPMEIADVNVDLTIFNGDLVYQRQG
jgi:predicted amidohydrolase YtcJ